MGVMETTDAKVINVNSINVDNKALLKPDSIVTQVDRTGFILDEDWSKRAFAVADSDIGHSDDVYNRYFSPADITFEDTTLGGSVGVNMRPGLCWYTDIRRPGIRSDIRNPVSVIDATGGHGAGRFHHEAFAENAQKIYLQFGFPQFNGIVSFLFRAYDAGMMSVARTGRGIASSYRLGQLLGKYVALVSYPQIALPIWTGQALYGMFSKPMHKYYTLKPGMPVYWTAVNNLVNNIAINAGMIPLGLSDEKTARLGRPFSIDGEYMQELQELLPDLFTGAVDSVKQIDVRRIAAKAQIRANALRTAQYNASTNMTASDFRGYLRKRNQTVVNTVLTTDNPRGTTFGAWLDNFVKVSNWFTSSPKDNKTDIEKDPTADFNPDDEKTVGNNKLDEDKKIGYLKYLDAEARDGTQYACLCVDFTGSSQASFSNVTTESQLSQKLNNTISGNADIRFALGEGGDLAGGIQENIIKPLMNVVSGVADSVTFGLSNILKGLSGAGYIDIQKHWQNSNASLPRASYSMSLVSPYGNVYSQIQNVYLPICMILAGVLPLSVGKSAYTSPLLCRLFDRGHCQIQTGIIESVSISMGTTNVAFNRDYRPLSAEVTFNIVDLSSIMHMPVSAPDGIIATIAEAFDTSEPALDPDSVLGDYLATIAGQDMMSQVYAIPRARLQAARRLISINQLFSPAAWASATHQGITTGILKYTGIGAVWEGAAATSSVYSGSQN
jgi:hypothetical protein